MTFEEIVEPGRSLIVRYMPLAISLARSFSRRHGIETAEAVGVAFLAMCEVGPKFDGKDTGGFVEIAKLRIASRLIDWKATRWKQFGNVDFTDFDSLPFPSRSPPDGEESSDSTAERILRESSPARRAVFEAIMASWNFEDAAKMPGMTRQKVKWHLHQARKEYKGEACNP